MRQEDLGINPKSGEHLKIPLTHAESAFLGIIWVDHVGRDNAISAIDLAEKYQARLHLPETREEIKRDVRHLQNHLIIKHDIPVYSAAGRGGGYWIGEEADAKGFYECFRERGLTGLTKASRGRRSGMIDVVMQMSFQWRDLVAKAGLTPPEGEDQSIEAPIQVVDAFLQRMVTNPERFAQGLRQLGEKYGSVLIPRDRYDAIVANLRAKSAEISDLVRSLEG